MLKLFDKIEESKEVFSYLNERNLLKQYKKAKNSLILWLYKNVDFKKREPKNDEIYYFRINKQFRAIWYIENRIFRVLKIDNHS